MEAVQDGRQRALLAETLLAEAVPPAEREVLSAVQELEEHAVVNRQRQLRTLIAEAERRADFAELAVLTQKKLELDRALRKLHQHRVEV
jgi:DNA primase